MVEMYNHKLVHNTLNQGHMTEYLVQAQWAEFIELKKVINHLYKKLGSPISILDIGVGDGRVLSHLLGIEEVWGEVGSYLGIDNSDSCVVRAKENIEKYSLKDKVTVLKLDAKNLDLLLDKKFDLIIATYFTAGNFAPNNFSNNLETNDNFEKIFRYAYSLLNLGGIIVLGSVYIDNFKTRIRQEGFYKKCGMTITTTENDSFTATEEGFWSQRFTQNKIKSYFNWINPIDIEIVPLDTYDFAMQVKIVKNHENFLVIQSSYLNDLTSKEVYYLNFNNITGFTHKELRAQYILNAVQNNGIKNIHIITAGNSGLALKREIGKRNANVNLTCLVDKNLDRKIKESLIGPKSKIIELDLKEKYLSEEIIRSLVPFDSFNATYIEGKQFDEVIKEVIRINPDTIILPLGSGELFNSFYKNLCKYNPKIKLIGVIPKGNNALSQSEKEENTLADKLVCKFILKEAKVKIDEALSKGHEIIEIDNEDIKRAMNIANELKTNVEYSGSVPLAVLSQVVGKKIFCVLTGNGSKLIN